MISRITALFVFTGLLLINTPVLAQDYGHEEIHQEEEHVEHNAHAEPNLHGDHADTHDSQGDDSDIKSVVKETIEHHLADSYEFHVTEGVSFPLPVILLDDGLKIFSSSKFDHGHSIAEANGSYYVMHHNKVYKTDANGSLNFDKHDHLINPRPLDFSITKNVFMILVMAVFMVVLFGRMAKSYGPNKTPKKAGRFLEPIVIYVRDEIAIPNIGEKHYKRYMSYLLTVFFFIWFLNLVGMTPLGINVTGNIAITFSLALITFIITQVSGKRDYWMHIFWMPGVPVVLKPVMAVIELIGLFVKPFSLMIRLYANMLAGHVVLMSIIGLIFVFGSWLVSPAFFGLTLVLSLLELLVAALQAYIFTMLAALYFGSAVEEHDHH